MQAVRTLHAQLGGRIACASGAELAKVQLLLAQVGLARWFGGAVFSGHELPRTKPAPDVYLAAAAHLGVSPARCLVVEDTPTGIQAGVAAGATVWAYAPPGVDAAPLLATGAQRVFAHMADLATLLGH